MFLIVKEIYYSVIGSVSQYTNIQSFHILSCASLSLTVLFSLFTYLISTKYTPQCIQRYLTTFTFKQKIFLLQTFSVYASKSNNSGSQLAITLTSTHRTNKHHKQQACFREKETFVTVLPTVCLCIACIA